MSLDVYLIGDTPRLRTSPGIFIRDGGQTREISRAEWDALNPGIEPVTFARNDETCTVFHANITHNLNIMAAAAGLYDAAWRPEEHGLERAGQLVEPLTTGLIALCREPVRFERLNPPNGWGDYTMLVRFVANYLHACRENPDAKVEVWR